MIDLNSRYYFLNNFPKEIFDKYKKLFLSKNFDDISTVEKLPGNSSFKGVKMIPEQEKLQLKDKLFDAMWLLTLPQVVNHYHCDMGKWWRLNVPISVDSKNSDVFVGKIFDRNWEGYGEYRDAPVKDHFQSENVISYPARAYSNPNPKDFDRIEFDRPLLLNAHNIVHTWNNRTDKIRCIIMFRFLPEEFDYIQEWL